MLAFCSTTGFMSRSGVFSGVGIWPLFESRGWMDGRKEGRKGTPTNLSTTTFFFWKLFAEGLEFGVRDA